MTGYCEECGLECRARIVDDSFDHEFGTEKIYRVESDCCEAPVFEDEQLIIPITYCDVRGESI